VIAMRIHAVLLALAAAACGASPTDDDDGVPVERDIAIYLGAGQASDGAEIAMFHADADAEPAEVHTYDASAAAPLELRMRDPFTGYIRVRKPGFADTFAYPVLESSDVIFVDVRTDSEIVQLYVDCIRGGPLPEITGAIAIQVRDADDISGVELATAPEADTICALSDDSSTPIPAVTSTGLGGQAVAVGITGITAVTGIRDDAVEFAARPIAVRPRAYTTVDLVRR
jgi:hypothetical protein